MYACFSIKDHKGYQIMYPIHKWIKTSLKYMLVFLSKTIRGYGLW